MKETTVSVLADRPFLSPMRGRPDRIIEDIRLCPSSAFQTDLAEADGRPDREPMLSREPRGGGLSWVRVAPLLVFLFVMAACAPAPPEVVSEEQGARGAELYRQHCQSCHGGPTGGSPTDFPPRHNAQGHTWHHGDCELIRWTLEGKPSFGVTGTTMPAFSDRLSEDDVRAILAHIKTWWTDEQQEAQARVTAALCE